MQQANLSRVQVRTFRPAATVKMDGTAHDLLDRMVAICAVCAFWGLIIITALETLR